MLALSSFREMLESSQKEVSPWQTVWGLQISAVCSCQLVVSDYLSFAQVLSKSLADTYQANCISCTDIHWQWQPTYICIEPYTLIYMYIYTYVCMYMHIRAIHTNIHIVEYVWWRPPLPDLLIAYLVVSRVQSAHVCIYSIHVCIYMYLAFMYLCIYIYTCTCIHALYIYIYKRIFSLFSAKSNITEPSVAMNTELENAKNHLQGVSW